MAQNCLQRSAASINRYLTELANLKKVGGTHRESVVREAFKDLLKSWGRSLDLTFIPEYEFETRTKERRYVDGALLHTLAAHAHRCEPLTPALSPRKRGEGASGRADAPKALLRADREAGLVRLDSETTLAGIPPEAWDYRLGNRSALEWILDQYKEKTPKDPTIREKFNTYRFADYKEKVIDLLARVTRVSVETVRIVEAMRAAKR